jgi:uncharacterized damage-inducible protein DinB
MRIPARLIIALLAAAGIAGVLDAQTAPATAQAAVDTDPRSVRWNRLVPQFFSEAAASRRAARAAATGDTAALRRIAQMPLPMLFRVYPLLSAAQYAAVSSAREKSSASAGITVASASATVLSEVFRDPAVRESIARELARDIGRARTKGYTSQQATADSLRGEDVARRVISGAPEANFGAAWTGTIPTGPGMWSTARGMPPMGFALATSRTWHLDSTSQFRPPPPPSFGTPEFQAALDEVRQVARDRNPDQVKLAQYWNRTDPFAIWNETASSALRRKRATEEEAARVLAVMNTAASDAAIACFEAKYHYWTLRPSQADTTLVLADSVGLPNFPSYPSGHACGGGALEAVLARYFPADSAAFARTAGEQAMSRLYGGIHYRFDNDVGLELGRAVGRYAVEQEQRGRLNRWAASPVAAQSPAAPQTPTMLNASIQLGAQHIRKMFTIAADRMSDADYAAKPTPEVRSFAQLLGHVADTNYWFCATAAGEKPPVSGIEKSTTARVEVQKVLGESFAYCETVFASMSDESKANALRKFNTRDMPAIAVLNFRNYHGLLHWGNAITYMRLRGKVPPAE